MGSVVWRIDAGCGEIRLIWRQAMCTRQSFVMLAREAVAAFSADLARNRGNLRMLIAILSFRVSHVASCHRKVNRLANIYAIPVILAHRFLTEWLFGMDIPAATKIGKGLIVDHGYALVINKHSVIGAYCRLRHCVTIGCKVNDDGSQGASPRIGDHVDIGAHATIIGDIQIGDSAIIGAGSVVVKDVPERAVVVGNPAMVVKFRD